MHLPTTDPIHKVSIIPRGHALGVTQTLPNEDVLNFNRQKALNFISFLMGGRSAEEVCFGEISSGASNDIERATALARKMVCHWGMSEKLGPIHFTKTAFSPFAYGDHQDYSEEKARQIDQEIYSIIEKNHQVAVEILNNHRDALERIAQGLIVWETLDFEQIKALSEGKDIGSPQLNNNKVEKPASVVAPAVV
jgi:cell division protease FtsH